MQELWTQWKPIQGLSKKYYIEAVSYDSEGFKIILGDVNDAKKGVLVLFRAVESYKWTEEAYRLETISMIDEIYGTAFYANWTFFKVVNSSYLQLLSKESYTIADSRDLLHFSFIESNSILDVIAGTEPKVELIEYP